jgi:hypothetical protein
MDTLKIENVKFVFENVESIVVPALDIKCIEFGKIVDREHKPSDKEIQQETDKAKFEIVFSDKYSRLTDYNDIAWIELHEQTDELLKVHLIWKYGKYAEINEGQNFSIEGDILTITIDSEG